MVGKTGTTIQIDNIKLNGKIKNVLQQLRAFIGFFRKYQTWSQSAATWD
jgi:hypothetical protein